MKKSKVMDFHQIQTVGFSNIISERICPVAGGLNEKEIFQMWLEWELNNVQTLHGIVSLQALLPCTFQPAKGAAGFGGRSLHLPEERSSPELLSAQAKYH